MCPITLTVIGTTMAATMSTLASGAGISAAIAAGGAAASTAAAGGTAAAAMAAGSVAAAGTGLVSGSAAAAATIAPTAASAVAASGFSTATGAFVGTGAGIGGTGITATAALGEVVALVGVGQAVHQHKESKERAKEARKGAADVAKAERQIAGNQASRETRSNAEVGATDVIKNAAALGEVYNLQNKGDVQSAILARQVGRMAQADKVQLDVAARNTQGDLRDAYRGVNAKERNSFRKARSPGSMGLALQLGSGAIGSGARAYDR